LYENLDGVLLRLGLKDELFKADGVGYGIILKLQKNHRCAIGDIRVDDIA